MNGPKGYYFPSFEPLEHTADSDVAWVLNPPGANTHTSMLQEHAGTEHVHTAEPESEPPDAKKEKSGEEMAVFVELAIIDYLGEFSTEWNLDNPLKPKISKLTESDVKRLWGRYMSSASKDAAVIPPEPRALPRSCHGRSSHSWWVLIWAGNLNSKFQV